MPTWGEIQKEIQSNIHNPNIIETVKQKYLKKLYDYTKRDVIIYASKWTAGDVPPHLISIGDEDVHGFMEATAGLKGKSLDLILHTGGGSAEATEAIMSYLRLKYPDDIRVIVPQAAMSAGTMLACASNEIIMAKHSSLGPIDPQFILQTSVGVQALPAHAILDQFELAKKELIADPRNLSSWLPMLNQFGPALLVKCKNQIEYSKNLVKNWLTKYMFADDNASTCPDTISEYLCSHSNFNTHNKHINIEEAKSIGLKISPLEDDNELQDTVLSVFHINLIAFDITRSVKVISNHLNNSYIKMHHPMAQAIINKPIQKK